jgi:hypothetical protein
VIVTQLSEEAQLKLGVIQSLLEACDRTAKLFLLLMLCERNFHISKLGMKCIII